MYFQPNTIYHVYNQGNNREPIFYLDENYLFFLRKMREHILPFADFLAYCLMPNHFHWLIYTHELGCDWLNASGPDFQPPDPLLQIPRSKRLPRQQLCHGINVALSSYTKAINKQENRSGSLFRKQTQARDGWCDEWITLTKRNGMLDWRFSAENDYAWNCFNYIHQNPVKAKLVSMPEEWEFSSARDYAGLRNGTLCNQELARELLRLV